MTHDPQNLIVRLWTTLWLGGTTDDIADLVADPYVRHSPGGTTTLSTAEYSRHIARISTHIEGTSLSFSHLDEVDDRIHARFTLHGINLASGEPISIAWIGEYRIAHGRLAESWTMRQTDFVWDD